MRETDAAVAIVHAGEPYDSVLLMRRAERADDPWSGHWSFPGGRRDPGDIDLLHTALRELEEECGLRLRRADMQAEMRPRHARRRGDSYVTVTPFLFPAAEELAVIPDQREAVEAVWVPLRMLANRDCHRLMPIPGMPPELRFPAVALGAAPLWGFTYRLIADWLGLSAGQDAGFRAASSILEFLQQRGLEVESGWTEKNGGKAARVRGNIPASEVLEEFSAGSHVLEIQCLEVRPGLVRVLGLGFEEYAIRADVTSAG